MQTISGAGPRRGPNVFVALGIANQGVSPDSVEKLLLAQIQDVVANGVTASKLASVTAAQAQQAAKRIIRPDQAVIVVVGDGAKLYNKLAAIAPVSMVSVEGDAMTQADIAK